MPKKTKKQLAEEKYIFLTELGKTYSKQLTIKATPEELILKKFLIQAKIRFEFQKPIVCLGFRKKWVLYIADFVLIDYKKIIEIDGLQHNTKEGLKKDNIRSRHLKNYGYEVKRLSNRQMKMYSSKELSEIFNFFLNVKKC